MRLVELLINAGADINYIPELGSNPIISAIAYNIRTDPFLHSEFMAKNTEILALLLDLNVNQDTFSPIYKDSNSEFTPLGYAMHIKANEAAEKLVEYGTNLNCKDVFEQMPLVRAIEANNIVGVKLLLSAGANIKITVKNNLKPLEIALSKRYYEIYNLLLEVEANFYSRF